MRGWASLWQRSLWVRAVGFVVVVWIIGQLWGGKSAGNRELSRSELVSWTLAAVNTQKHLGQLRADVARQPNAFASWHTAWRYEECVAVPLPTDVSYDAAQQRWKVDPMPALKVYMYPLQQVETGRTRVYSQGFLRFRRAFWTLAKQGRVKLVDSVSEACLRVPALDPFMWNQKESEEYVGWLRQQDGWDSGRNHVFLERHDNVKLEYDDAWLVRMSASTPYMASRVLFDLVLPLPLALVAPLEWARLSEEFGGGGSTLKGTRRKALLVFNSKHFPDVDALGDWRNMVGQTLEKLAETERDGEVVDLAMCESAQTLQGSDRSVCEAVVGGEAVATFAVLHGSAGWRHRSLPGFVEALGAGMVPVVVNDYYPEPLVGVVHHGRFMLHVAESAVGELGGLLRRMRDRSAGKVAAMQRMGKRVHRELSTAEGVVGLVVKHVVRKTMMYGFRLDKVGRHEIWAEEAEAEAEVEAEEEL